MFQVMRRQRECLSVYFGIAHKCTADLILKVHPFVHIECHRIGPLHPLDNVTQCRRERNESTERSVDVKPEIFVFAEICKRVD
jgi:hypothetical protein